MSKYSEQELRKIVSSLLAKRHEGDYWDYKREWPPSEENTDLVKDIICFANTTHSRDCFIIYGAEDDGKPYKMQNKRRNQNELTDLLTHSPMWAGCNHPSASVETIQIKENVYDVIIIYNSDRTPFYLQKDYVPEIKYPSNATQEEKREIDARKQKKTLHKGIIYARSEDSSTSFGGMANPYTIEQLWRKRFHLLQPLYSQFIEEMRLIDNWQSTEGEKYHNIYRPEFTFQYRDEEPPQTFDEFYVRLFPDTKAYRRVYTCNYYGTVLREVYIVSIDGGRWQIPYPHFSLFCNQRYFYLIEESDDMVIYDFLNSQNTNNPNSYLQSLTKYVPLFIDETEHSTFEQWLQKHQDEFESEKSKLKSKCASHNDVYFKHEEALGERISNMLKQFRQFSRPSEEGL